MGQEKSLIQQLGHNSHVDVSLVDVEKSDKREIQGYPGAVVASVAYILEGSSLQIKMRGMVSGHCIDMNEKVPLISISCKIQKR